MDFTARKKDLYRTIRIAMEECMEIQIAIANIQQGKEKKKSLFIYIVNKGGIGKEDERPKRSLEGGHVHIMINKSVEEERLTF